MTEQLHVSNSKCNQAIGTEQLNQIVEAILAGKYSWACVLLLRCAGYNPLHYIPYRTYNRLLKDNYKVGKPSQEKTVSINKHQQHAITRFKGKSSQKGLGQINDLAYLDGVDEQSVELRGGSGANEIPLLMKI